MNIRRTVSAGWALAALLAGVGVWIAACSVSVTSGTGAAGDAGNGAAVAFTIAGKTITLKLGVVGVFNLTPGVTSTNLAAVQPFAAKPADDVASASMWLSPSDVQVRPYGDTKSALTRRADQTGTVLLRVAIDRPGATDPCATGTSIGTFEIEVQDGRIVSVSRALQIRYGSLQRFLANDMTMCMEADAPFEGELNIDLFELQFQPLGTGDTRECGNIASVQTTPEVCCMPVGSGYEYHLDTVPVEEWALRGECVAIGEIAPYHSIPLVQNRQQCVCWGGVAQGEGTTCESTVCDEPFEACCTPVYLPGCIEVGLHDCLDNVSCFEALAEDCEGYGGIPQGAGVHCHDSPCEIPDSFEACCREGRCMNQNPDACESDGGKPQGAGTTCFTTYCAPEGACCIGGTCTLRTEADCKSASGTYQGDETYCDPNPCEQATGACCLADGSCSTTTQSACESAPGTYQGDNISCDSTTCPQPTGACCWSGGCISVSAEDCAALEDGEFQGDDTDCGTTSCEAPAEYVIWYTGNVCCWGAPLLYITDRDGFEQSAARSSFPGGGIDASIPVVKVEYQGGFASEEDARDWVCPQFTSQSYHYWCGAHYQMDGKNWQPGGLGCDLGSLPSTETPPESDLCQ